MQCMSLRNYAGFDNQNVIRGGKFRISVNDKKQTQDASLKPEKPGKAGGLAGLAAYGSDNDNSGTSHV